MQHTQASQIQVIFDLAIIGAGAAGLTAALYALRARKSVLILEQNAIGGQILPAAKIHNYPAIAELSGQEFAEQLQTQVRTLGANFALEAVEQVEQLSLRDFLKKSDFAQNSENSGASTQVEMPLFKLSTDEGTHYARTVIIANGSAERKLDLPGEQKLIGHGISYCATCDGALFAGRTVAVYGGGSSALSAALYLSNLAQKVYLINRSARLRGEPKLLEQIETRPNLELKLKRIIRSLKTQAGKLTAIELAEPDTPNSQTEKGEAEASEDGLEQLAIDGLFVNIGRVADNKIFSTLVDLDEDGYILADETCITKTPGIFCAGDTRKKTLRQLITAEADGASAAMAAINFLDQDAN